MSEHLPDDQTQSVRGHSDPRQPLEPTAASPSAHQRNLIENARQEARAASAGSHRPETIGPYKILQVLGEGGMGIVYLAEQSKPIHRRVALKIIKLGMDTKQVIARFETEREALALMNHANVAKVFDAGVSETGRPYFVMEYVPGIPITEYCDKHRLSTHERLLLFMDVCHAVQHAHQKGIIHRDIKPSNVLVAVDASGPHPAAGAREAGGITPPLAKGGSGGVFPGALGAIVKVIDFGVAKATQHRLTEQTLFTEQGQLIGTPGYMSPEQAEMTALDIDTRTDIYSLGVLLYELLVGALPFDTETLRRAGLAEMQRIIREVDPLKPSTRLSAMQSQANEPRALARADAPGLNAFGTSDDSLVPNSARAEARGSLVQIAHQRDTEPKSLIRQLRGDLDWIVMKCLEKDRTRRYETANGVAREIQRYLCSEPVLAGPPTAAYRIKKFVRRNRAAVLAISAVVLALTTGLVGSTVMYVRAEQARAEASAQRDRAEAEAQRAKTEATKSAQIATYMLDMIQGPVVYDFHNKIVFREFLNDTAEQVAGSISMNLPRQHREQKTNANLLGAILCGFGRYAEAEPLLVESYAVLRDDPGLNPQDKKDMLERLVRLYDSWNAVEPDKGYAEKAAEWRTKLDETSKSQDAETPK